jgi:hypothetical protein
MNFQGLNPSIGASFQAPPTAVSQPPTPPMRIVAQPGSGGSTDCNAVAATHARTKPRTIAAPTA